jgi:hypothetical protein
VDSRKLDKLKEQLDGTILTRQKVEEINENKRQAALADGSIVGQGDPWDDDWGVYGSPFDEERRRARTSGAIEVRAPPGGLALGVGRACVLAACRRPAGGVRALTAARC